ncbi:hypothetical protein ABZ383_00070 [Streptomyces sp. NPDC005900]|uniref:hypothetical protein n=1 Tax=Streptomyces sp. NPDC005900 TaxID=3154569 RepID=UPI0033CB85F5
MRRDRVRFLARYVVSMVWAVCSTRRSHRPNASMVWAPCAVEFSASETSDAAEPSAR